MTDDAALEISLDVSGTPAGADSSVSLDLLVSASLEIPGVRLAVDSLRASLALGLELGPGGLGLRPPQLTVAPPAGMSAELVLPGFGGGGYLAHRGDAWRGALAADLGPVSVSGFGIVRTDRFSILVLLAAEFTPAIQLSFGFTLVGVGGLVGINRRPDVPALSAAVSSGDLSRLLFPADPVGEADALLTVLDGCFPPSDGSFVVGPMLKLGWGTPTLVSATLGLLVSDVGMVILGRVAITLPCEEFALVRLQAVILGTVDADGLAIDASLADSQIVGIPVEGDIRLRVRGGADAVFAFSAGGFHPAFQPPRGMTGMRRIGTEISPGDILRVRLEAYLAVTTASVQFGAHAELEAGFAGFGIRGHLDFDALFCIDPFGFMVDFSAGVSIECADFSVGSVELSGSLGGPSPWRIRGSASISILWFDIDVDLPEITWGDPAPPPLAPARDPLGVLLHELSLRANWSATSRAVPSVVQLRPDATTGSDAVHPLAELGFRQTAVPLQTALARMDGVPLAQPVTLDVRAADATPVALTRAPFPPTQFLELTDTAKLSSAGYADLGAGIDLQPAGFVTGTAVARDEEYETTVLGTGGVFVRSARTRLLDGVATQVGHATLPQPDRLRLVDVRDPGLTVLASVDTLTDVTPQFVGTATALAAGPAHAVLDRAVANLARDVRVARVWEVAP